LFTALSTTAPKTTEAESAATLPALVALPTLAPETTQPPPPTNAETNVVASSDSESGGTKVYIYVVAIVLGLILIAMAYLYMSSSGKSGAAPLAKSGASTNSVQRSPASPSGIVVNDQYQPSPRHAGAQTQEDFERLAAQILNDASTPAIVSVTETGM